MRYRPGLDGLRAISVALVVVYHSTFASQWQLPGGFLGVDVFFVISGCLITSLLIREWDRTAAVDLRGFYLRRALRLGPALVVLLVFVATLQRWVGPAGNQPLWQPVVSTALYLANWWQVAHPGASTYLDHTWSLAIEEQFYLLWPATALLLLRRGRTPRRLAMVAGVGVLTAAAVRWTWYANWRPHGLYGYKVLYENTLTRGDSLLVGVVIGCLLAEPQLRDTIAMVSHRLDRYPGYRRWLVEVTPWLAAVDLALLIKHANIDSPWLYRFGFTLVALLAGVAVAHAMLVDRSLFVRVLTIPPLVWLGRISYGVYLFHVPIAVALVEHTSLGPLMRLLVVSSTSVAAAAASFWLVERHALAVGRRTRRLPVIGAPTTGLVGVPVEQPP